MKRILFVSNMTTYSGGEIVLERLMQNLDGYESFLAVPPGPFADRINGNKCAHVQPVSSLQKLNRDSNKLYPLHFIKALIVNAWTIYRIAKKYKCDLIVGNSFGVAGYTAFAAALARKPSLWIHHHPFLKAGTFESKAAILFSKWVKTVSCVSDAIRSSLVDAGINKTIPVTVHNGLDLQQFDPARIQNGFLREQFNFQPDVKLIGIVGVITSWKGHYEFLECVKYLDENKLAPQAHFVIVGDVMTSNAEDVEYKKLLQSYIRDNRLEQRVTFTGRLNSMERVYMDLDVVVNNSISPEPFGTTIYEAMALEKVVIATDLGGSPEIVDNGVNGFLVPAGNPRLLADCIQVILEETPLISSIRRNAREKVVRELSISRMAAEYKAMFDGLLADSNVR